MKKVNAREAEKIMERLGQDWGGDGKTYYATNDEETEVYVFNTITKRNEFLEKHNNAPTINDVKMNGKQYGSVWEAIKAANGIK